MNIVDDSYKTLREEGYEGSKSDLVYKKLKDLTGLSSSTPDMWYQWLRSLGYNGSVNDMLNQHLAGKGYGSSLQDALARSFSNRDLYYANEGMTALFDIQRYINSGVGTNFEGLFDITRSSSKYVWGTGAQTGQLVEVPPNTPAYQHDPITGAPLGVLVEGSATNLFEYSEDFLQSYWVKERTNVSPSSEPSVFVGGVTHKVDETAVTNSFRIRANVPVLAQTYSPYFIVKAAERSKVRVFTGGNNALADIDLTDGSILAEAAGTAFVEEIANGWWKVGITETQPSAATTLHLLAILDDAGNFTYTGEAGKGIYVCHADLKQESKPSSPIVTTGSTLTRAADIVTSDAATFGDWFNASEGTFVVEFDKDTSDTSSIGRVFSDASVSNLSLYIQSGDDVKFDLRGIGGTGFSDVGTAVDGTNKIEMSFLGATLKTRLNGGSVIEHTVTGNLGNQLLSNGVMLGSRPSGNYLNNTIKSMIFKDKATL